MDLPFLFSESLIFRDTDLTATGKTQQIALIGIVSVAILTI